jgi:hypothetical protein
MGMAQHVQQSVTFADAVADPRFGTVPARGGAGIDYRGKRGVAGNAEAPGFEGFGQRARAAKAVKRKDRPIPRFHPKYFGIIARIGHREDALTIGLQEQPGIDRLRRWPFGRAGGRWGLHGFSFMDLCRSLVICGPSL